jgi:hypothetical protein
MSEDAPVQEKTMSKQEIEEKLDRTQIQANAYQAAIINKLLTGTSFRLDLYENCK